MAGIVLICGCVQPSPKESTTAAVALQNFLDKLIQQNYSVAANQIIDLEGETLSAEVKEQLISLWEEVKLISYHILTESALSPSEMAKSPFSEGKKFIVETTTIFGPSLKESTSTTDYYVVKHEGAWKIFSPILDLLRLEGKWNLQEESHLHVSVSSPWFPGYNPKAGEKGRISLSVANFGSDTYPEDDYIIRLYYAPLEIVEIGPTGGYVTRQVENVPFKNIAEWRETIKPSQKTEDDGFLPAVHVDFVWTLPQQPQDAYEFRATVEKIASKEPLITKIIAWGKLSFLTFEANRKIKEKIKKLETGAEIKILSCARYPSRGGFKVEVKNTGSGAVDTLRLRFYYQNGHEGGSAERGRLEPGETTELSFCCGANVSEIKKIRVESALNPEIYDEIEPEW